MALIFPAPAQIRNLLDPTANTDAATKQYVDNSLSGGTIDINVGNANVYSGVVANTVTSNTIISTGNLQAGNISGANLIAGNYFSGNGSLLTNINGSNVSGIVANANYAAYAGNITIAAQSNITSLGTLTSLTVTGNITAGNVNGGNLVKANYISGNGSLLSSITGGNVTGYVAFATSADNATDAQFVTSSSQPNITSVGTLTSLTVSGVTNLGNIGNVKITGGTANYVLSTDGTGNLSWVAAGSSGTLSADVDTFTGDGTTTDFTLAITPTGGNYTIVAVQGVLQPKSSYTITGRTLAFSSAPPNTALIEVTTFGGAVVSGTGSGLKWNVVSSNVTLTVNNGYFADTSGGAKTLTLPSAPSLGDTIRINDLAGTFNTNNLTVAANSKKIQGSTDDLLIDYAQASVTLVYSNSTYGWKILES